MLKVNQATYMYQVNQGTGHLNKNKESNLTRSLDQVEKSATSKEIRDLVEQAKKMSLEQEEKIAAIKSKYDSGTYELSSERIASAMIDEGFGWL